MDFHRLKKLFKEELEKLRSEMPEKVETVKEAATESYEHVKESVGTIASHIRSGHTESGPAIPFPQRVRDALRGSSEDRIWIDIKLATLIKVLVTVLVLFSLVNIISQLGDIFVQVLLSVIIASALGPIVDKWHARGINRLLAAILLYVLILAVLTLIIALIVPVIGDQIIGLSSYISSRAGTIAQDGFGSLPIVGQFFPHAVSSEQLAQQVQSQIQNIGSSLLGLAGNLGKVVGTVFGGLFSFITVLILSFYMVIQKHSFEEFISTLSPSRYEAYLVERSRLVREKMGAWLRGQIIVIAIIAAMAFVGLVIFQINYALILAIFAGLMTIIPYIGPALGAAAAIIVAWADSPWKAVAIALYYFIAIQFFESNFVTPLVMKKAVGLNPITILIVLLIGGQLFGMMGFVLAVPVTTALKIFVKDISFKEKHSS